VGTLTPLGKVATHRRTWIIAVASFTAAGAATSAAVGAFLGALGGLLIPVDGPVWRVVVVGCIAAAVVAIELSLVRITFPQPRRQTQEIWGKRYGIHRAAILWGADLGLLFTSWFTLSGIWLLIGVAVTSQSAVAGATTICAYWVGRATSVWLGPILMRDSNDALGALRRIADARQFIVYSHVAVSIATFTVFVAHLRITM
jgi:hypothetical protein